MATTAGGTVTTTDLTYSGDGPAQEITNGTVTRTYVTDEAGTIVRFCDPDCANPTASYLIGWNAHGDALNVSRINADGTLTLANSYRYDTWGRPTTTTHNGLADLGFRYLYVGAADVQWDNGLSAGLLYMHARTYTCTPAPTTWPWGGSSSPTPQEPTPASTATRRTAR